MPKLLLHACCAPCACYPIELLKGEYDITLFFYNPNIHPKTEYQARLAEIKKFCLAENIKLVEGEYDVRRWFELTKDMKHEPEKGKRCDICYEIRMRKTAEYAKVHGFDCFGTDLSISPHKKADVINDIGKKLEQDYGVKYLAANFKKQDGFKKSLEISHKHNFYRQDYCGCTFSKRDRTIHNQNKQQSDNNTLI